MCVHKSDYPGMCMNAYEDHPTYVHLHPTYVLRTLQSQGSWFLVLSRE